MCPCVLYLKAANYSSIMDETKKKKRFDCETYVLEASDNEEKTILVVRMKLQQE
jgi:hypothetical protein